MGLKMNQKGLIMDQQRFIAVLKRHIRQQVFVSAKPQKELSALKKLFRYQIQCQPKAHFYIILTCIQLANQKNVNFHLQGSSL